jgi:tRNA 2-thiouridine synthesizing protein A
MNNPSKPITQLDVTGLQCPLPVLKAQKALRDLPLGAEIVVLASDPAAKIDFPHYCNQSGNHLVESLQKGEIFHFRIRKTSP